MESNEKPLVLATTDFTDIGDCAIDHAVSMARILNGKVLILHVIDKRTMQKLQKQGQTEDFARERLDEMAKNIEKIHAIETQSIVTRGSLFRVIADTAVKHQALFHFIGTPGKKGIQWITGSFALRVVKRSPVPVIVIQEPAGGINYKKIIYPLDLQPGSKQKVKWAKILHKAAGSHFDVFVENFGDESTDKKLKADLKQLTEILDHHNIPHSITFSSPRGSFANQILAFAKEKNADAIMITSDPDKLAWNPFNTTEERVLYNPDKIPVMFINSKNLRLVVGGP